MNPNSPFRKLIQISEETLPIVHGNDVFIVTQQDLRKIEDTRLYTISKLMANGDLKTISEPNASLYLHQLQGQENVWDIRNTGNLLDILNNKRNYNQECQQQACGTTCPQPMEVSAAGLENCASIEQQLQWNKCENISKPFPPTYSLGTSTTEIDYRQEIKSQRNMPTCTCCNMCSKCGKCKMLCNKSTNTLELKTYSKEKSNEVLSAREKLKNNKIRLNYII